MLLDIRLPLNERKLKTATPIELDSFLFETKPLHNAHGAIVGACTHLACRIDDPMPGHRAMRIKGAERITDIAGMPRDVRQSRDLTVSRYAPAGYARHDPIDILVRDAGRRNGSSAQGSPRFKFSGRRRQLVAVKGRERLIQR